MPTFKHKDKDLFYFEVNSYSGSCGANILSNFRFEESRATSSQMKAIATAFRNILLKSYKGNNYSLVDSYGRPVKFSVGVLWLSDAVYGEEADPEVLSIYRLCTEVDGYNKSPFIFNPNSNNVIQFFSLNISKDLSDFDVDKYVEDKNKEPEDDEVYEDQQQVTF